MTDLGLP